MKIRICVALPDEYASSFPSGEMAGSISSPSSVVSCDAVPMTIGGDVSSLPADVNMPDVHANPIASTMMTAPMMMPSGKRDRVAGTAADPAEVVCWTELAPESVDDSRANATSRAD